MEDIVILYNNSAGEPSRQVHFKFSEFVVTMILTKYSTTNNIYVDDKIASLLSAESHEIIKQLLLLRLSKPVHPKILPHVDKLIKDVLSYDWNTPPIFTPLNRVQIDWEGSPIQFYRQSSNDDYDSDEIWNS